MASLSEGHDVIKDYCCTICEDKNIVVAALFYCQKCATLFCDKCIDSHRQHGWILNKQSPYGRNKMKMWPLSKTMENFLLTCDVHKNEAITLFCQDHSQLCCNECVDLNHRLCFEGTPIHQAAEKMFSDFKTLIVRAKNTLAQMKQLQGAHEKDRKSIKGIFSRFGTFKVIYNEHERSMVEGMRLNIKSVSVESKNSINNKKYDHKQYTVDAMRQQISHILAEFENSSVKEKKIELTIKLAPIVSVINTSIRLHAELLRLHDALQQVKDKQVLHFLARTKCQEKIRQCETYVNNTLSDRIFTIYGKSEHNVRIPSDTFTCKVRAICVLPDGQVLLADRNNKKVKLLNRKYRVVSHCDVTSRPQTMCQITPSEVAVSMGDQFNMHEVQYITKNKSHLIAGRKFQLQHTCRDIVHYQGDLYITSGRVLYKYSMCGKLICKLYEDTSSYDTVYKCDVNSTGDKLYITNLSQSKLLTLARDGSVLATFTDREIQLSHGVRVTPAGQVLVCGCWSHTIIQVDSEGRKKLATLATERDGVKYPLSACYNNNTDSIMVIQGGYVGNNNILVFRVQKST